MEQDSPKSSIEEIDFSLWEKLYGRPLDYFEKLEIKTNLLGFTKVLIEEDLRQREVELAKYREEVRVLLGSKPTTT